MFRFVLSLTLAAGLLIGIPKFLLELPSFGWQIIAFLFIATLAVRSYILRFHKQGLAVQAVLGSVLIKLLGSLAFLLVIVLEDRSGAVANAVYFLVAYALFTTIEIAFLYPRISR